MHRDSNPTRYGKEVIIRCQSASLSLLVSAGMDVRLRNAHTRTRTKDSPGSDLLALNGPSNANTHLCATSQWQRRLVVERQGQKGETDLAERQGGGCTGTMTLLVRRLRTQHWRQGQQQLSALEDFLLEQLSFGQT